MCVLLYLQTLNIFLVPTHLFYEKISNCWVGRACSGCIVFFLLSEVGLVLNTCGENRDS